MRVVLLADKLFATRERAMLSRLKVGLADEGMRIIEALPAGIQLKDQNAIAQTMRFEQVGLPLSLKWRAQAACRSVLALCDDSTPPEIVHVFGGSIWDFGFAMAEQLGAALVVEAWRAGLARAAYRVASRHLDRHEPIILAPDKELKKTFLQASPNATIRMAPWGTFVPAESHKILKAGKVWSIMICGTGINKAAYAAAFEALASCVRARKDILLFADALAARRADLWALAARLGVQDRFSLVDEMDANRELVLRGDVLILPEARGEQRSLVLEAMSQGMPVVAATDPLNSSLIDNQTAKLARLEDQASWTQAISTILGNPTFVHQLTVSAREYIRQSHRPSRQIGCVIDAYESAVGKASIPFPR